MKANDGGWDSKKRVFSNKPCFINPFQSGWEKINNKLLDNICSYG